MTRNNKRKPRPAKSRSRRYRRINSLLERRRADAEDEFNNQEFSEDVNISQETVIGIDVQKPLADLLRTWINCHGITTRAVNDLLQIFKKSGIMKLKKINNLCHGFSLMIFFDLLDVKNLPTDYRTLLRTPKTVKIVSAAGGQLWYNGIESNLQNVFSKLNKNISIELNFNVDGLPIFKSSQRCFWLILANIHSNYHETFAHASIIIAKSNVI